MRHLLLKKEEEEEDSEVAEHFRMFACYEVTSEKLSLQFSKLRNVQNFSIQPVDYCFRIN
jgi:hypothetical protein